MPWEYFTQNAFVRLVVEVFLFPQVSEMSNTLGIISHRILQQRWGNVLAFQTYLQCQGSSEELYMGSRMHHGED